MEITFNTKIVDVSVALNALKLYREKNYKLAASKLLDILDVEPNNWQARLMLGACHYKLEEFISAQRVFRFLYDVCPEEDTKRKAFEGLQASNTMLCKPQDIPAEFGCHVDRKPAPKVISWLDEAPQKRPGEGHFRSSPSRW